LLIGQELNLQRSSVIYELTDFKKQELLTLREHMGSSSVRVVHLKSTSPKRPRKNLDWKYNNVQTIKLYGLYY
jgi:hypothetical protein